MLDAIKPQGYFDIQCHNPDGSLAWEERLYNGATTPGLNAMLDDFFSAGTQKPNWYFMLIDAAGFTGVASTDTTASHSGWAENVAYSEGTRPAWTAAAASAGSKTSSAASTATMNASASIKGAALVSNSTKSGTSGVLWATALFANIQVLTNGQVLSFTYTVPLVAT